MGVSNVKIEPMNVSWNGVDLGLIEGQIELKFASETFDVKAHQTGAQILDKIRTGTNLENISIELKETHVAQLKAMMADGDTFTPTAVGATEVVGYGKSKLFSNMSADAQKLVFHPARLVSTDKSQDICFWKTIPQVSGLNYSGEENSLLAVEFVVLPDPTKVDEVNIMLFGDHTQDFAV